LSKDKVKTFGRSIAIMGMRECGQQRIWQSETSQDIRILEIQTHTGHDDDLQRKDEWDRSSPLTSTDLSHVERIGAQAQHVWALKFEESRWPQWEEAKTEPRWKQ
jgi:hypothetical protein